MATKERSSNQTPEDSKYKRSGVRFATYPLVDCIAVARAIHEQGGGAATLDQLSAFLGYAGTNNGAFLARLASTRSFGLIQKSGEKYVPTQLAQSIVMPVYDWMAKEAMVQAFLNVELFAKIYEEYKGKELPPEVGLKNALKTLFDVLPNRVDRAYRALMDSADQAGFFSTRATRTHLIMPTIPKSAGSSETAPGTESVAGESERPVERTPVLVQQAFASDPAIPPSTSTMQAVKAKYVSTLISILEERAKNGDEPDEALMARIEKLLNENQ